MLDIMVRTIVFLICSHGATKHSLIVLLFNFLFVFCLDESFSLFRFNNDLGAENNEHELGSLENESGK